MEEIIAGLTGASVSLFVYALGGTLAVLHYNDDRELLMIGLIALAAGAISSAVLIPLLFLLQQT